MSAVHSVSAEIAYAEERAGRRRLPILNALTVTTGIGLVVGLYFGLVYAGQDALQGDIQRIFYFHMPAFIGAFVALSTTVIGGVMYLRTRAVRWDNLAVAGVEVGITLATINIVTGMIWARPIWNAWWTWDPRLTLEAIMILTYAAYLMLRQGIENPETRRRFAAVYGILAIITVIMVLLVIRVRNDTIHPTVLGTGGPQSTENGGFAMTSSMRAALGVNMAVWALLVPITLMWWRVRLQALAERVSEAKARLLSK